MRFILVLLLAFISTFSLAEDKYVIDYYREAITDLKFARKTIEKESEAAAKEVAKIDALIAKYEAALKTTTETLVNDYQTRLQELEGAYAKKLASISELADLSLKSAQRAEKQVKAISTELKANFSKTQIVYNSVANEQGADAKGDADTLAFWQIPYQDRFKVKGIPELGFNYYNPTLYQTGPAIYVDVVEDLDGKVAMLMTASADGIDPKTMKMINPKFLGGQDGAYNAQFASGWSSDDYDGDTSSTDNCATHFGKITQHYSSCWNYNLGADADSPVDDKHWGPHLHSPDAQSLNLKTDGSGYTRVRRITRYIIF
ncbi:hypothetical protein [Candidatus Parabeggiatoa sp. HSG14]|uniref:hypothetical protein n=1 Tax=Candidatus Parabeggiatoa sp. HSG14 TaxID=3055593 RepID=UPI0025A6FC80|nr:hypothetical protein [Thiotrichales bacterium HSG14]